MTTDFTEQELEHPMCSALADHLCDPPPVDNANNGSWPPPDEAGAILAADQPMKLPGGTG